MNDLEKQKFNPGNYRKTNIKTRPKKIGQTFFLAKGSAPCMVTSKVSRFYGFTSTGKPRTKTSWHYTYLRNTEWNAFTGGFYGKSLEYVDMREAEYVPPEVEQYQDGEDQ